MRKTDFIKRVAREQGVGPSSAADRVDRVVTQILRSLRSGNAAYLPGLGTILPGKQWAFQPENREETNRGRQ